MKIKDILNRLDVIAEAEATKQAPLVVPQSLTDKIASDPSNQTVQQQNPPIPKQNAGTAAGYKGSAGAQAIAKANGIANPNEIKAGKVIQVNGQPYTIKAGDTLDKIAAANKGSATPAAAPEPAATANAGSGGTDQNAPGVSTQVAAAQGKPPASNAATLAAAQGKEVPADTPAATSSPNSGSSYTGNIGTADNDPVAGAEGDGVTPGAAAALANMGKPTGSPEAPADDLARMTQLAGAGKPPAAGGYGNFTGGQQSAQPEPAAATAAAAPQAVNPSAGAQPVKTGTGGTLTTRDGKPVMTRSDNEIWWSQQPGNMGKQYPGDAVAQQQYDARQAAGKKNMDALKGVGNKIANFFSGNKQSAPAPAPAAGGYTHPGTPEEWAKGNNPPVDWIKDPATGKYSPPTQPTTESEMFRIRHLAGL